MKGTPKITVLMPSLNVSPYIRQCMDSVIKQSLSDIEIIVVDAGSTDGTLEILREYEKKDSRVRVILSDRKSYGYQMNIGLDAARGNYIGIIETDDWAESDMFEHLYQAAEANDADEVKSNYYLYYTNDPGKNKFYEVLAGCEYGKITNALKNNGRLFFVPPSIWSAVYRRSMLEKNHIRFNETPGASFQDTAFFYSICTFCERFYFLEDAFLHYRQDNISSSVNSPEKVYCICEEMHYFENVIQNRDIDSEKLYTYYLPSKFERYLWNYNRIDQRFQWDFLQRIREEFLAHSKNGQIVRNGFADDAWGTLQRLLKDPLRFYLSTCKGSPLFIWARNHYFNWKTGMTGIEKK